MKKLSIILACALVAMMSCTKSKEVHPEIGDGNDEILTVGIKDVHVEYTRTDHAELSRVVFHYSLAEVQQFEAAEMAKRETFFELTLDNLLCDALYSYYYELFYNGGETSTTELKTVRTQACDTPTPPTPPSGVPEGAVNVPFAAALSFRNLENDFYRALFAIFHNGDRIGSRANLQNLIVLCFQTFHDMKDNRIARSLANFFLCHSLFISFLRIYTTTKNANCQ